MTRLPTQDCPRPRVGVKPPPGGAVGGCPARCATRTTGIERMGMGLGNKTRAKGAGK